MSNAIQSRPEPHERPYRNAVLLITSCISSTADFNAIRVHTLNVLIASGDDYASDIFISCFLCIPLKLPSLEWREYYLN